MWEAHVWRTIHGMKSKQGNWYEGRFRRKWAAYIAARWMAWCCDIETPVYCCVGIRWGIRKVE